MARAAWAILAGSAVGFAGAVSAQSYTYMEVDPPGSISSYVSEINASGVATGSYVDGGGHSRGFVDAHGRYSTFDPFNSSESYASAINNSGEVVGQYLDGFGYDQGFLEKNGSYTIIFGPGSVSTDPVAINSSGEVTGYYSRGQGVIYGFIESNGVYQTLQFPGSAETVPTDINDAGIVSGYYIDLGGAPRAFEYIEPNFESFNPTDSLASIITSINNNDDAVGIYESRTSFKTFGFELSQGLFHPVGDEEVDAVAINDFGVIAGSLSRYHGTINTDRGFIGVKGVFESIYFPGSLATDVLTINDSDAVAGYYSDGGAQYGFIATPVPEPGSWVTLLLGIAGLGKVIRGARRKSQGAQVR